MAAVVYAGHKDYEYKQWIDGKPNANKYNPFMQALSSELSSPPPPLEKSVISSAGSGPSGYSDPWVDHEI